jgi:hypothetical protein
MANLFPWLYNSNTGEIAPFPIQVATFELHSGLGWHGPFDSKQEAINYYNANKDKNKGWAAPVGLTDIGGQLDNAGKSAANDIAKATLGGVNIGVWFLRIGEILVGIVLLGVGVAKLTGTTNAIAKLAKMPPIIPV